MGASAIGAMGSIGGGLIGALAAKDINSAQLRWAGYQFREEQNMANTAHQREVKDLIAAGLNPILSATGGHGAPVAQAVNPGSLTNPGDSLQRGISDASQYMIQGLRLDNETKVATAQQAKLEADARNTDADTILKTQEGSRSDLTTAKLIQSINESVYRQAETIQGTATSSALAGKYRADTGLTVEETKILNTLVPFLQRGGTAVNQLVDYLSGGGKLGDAAATWLESVNAQVRKLGAAGANQQFNILDTLRKLFKPKSNPGAGPGATFDPQ